jgi:hypothetical protein
MVWGMMSVRTVAQPIIEAAWKKVTSRGRRAVAQIPRPQIRTARIVGIPAFG